LGHYWYEVLEALVMPGSPTAPAAVASKVALDQLLQTPFGMALFFATMKVLEGKPREVPQELRAKVRAVYFGEGLKLHLRLFTVPSGLCWCRILQTGCTTPCLCDMLVLWGCRLTTNYVRF
jgi:hypothetical protein